MTSHTRLVTEIVTKANKLPRTKAIKLKASVYLEIGTPDCMICRRGQLYMVEVKTGKAKRRKIQECRAVQWAVADAVVIEARSWQDVADALLGVSMGPEMTIDKCRRLSLPEKYGNMVKW